jgi:hypothetical protein
MRTTGPKLAGTAKAHRRKANRTRPCILVAEDYGVIGMMLYEDLSEAGFEYRARSRVVARLSRLSKRKPQMRPFSTSTSMTDRASRSPKRSGRSAFLFSF